jgi:tetratricopeptide (TPR) repeat protein
LGVLILVGTGAGGYFYALNCWHAAQRSVREDRPADAQNKLKVCLIVWPRSVPVHLLAARAARLNGDFSLCESHLNRCSKLQNGASEAIQLEFLLLRVRTGDVDAVAPILLDAVERKHPESPVILETLALSYMHNLRLQPAYACLSQWIEENPEVAKPYFCRGWVQERLNKPKLAMEDYKKALEYDPEHVQARLRVAEILLEDKLPLEAAPHLERLHGQFPERADIMARLGQCRILQNRTAEARQLLEAAEKKLPDDPPLLINLGRLDLVNRPDKAEERARHVLKLDPTDTEARYLLISALQAQNRTDEANAALGQLEKDRALLDRASHLLQDEATRPGIDPALAHEIGATFLKIGQERLAIYWLEQALQRDPKHQPTHRILSEYYQKNGDEKRAAAHRRQISEPDIGAKKP